MPSGSGVRVSRIQARQFTFGGAAVGFAEQPDMNQPHRQAIDRLSLAPAGLQFQRVEETVWRVVEHGQRCGIHLVMAIAGAGVDQPGDAVVGGEDIPAPQIAVHECGERCEW